MSPFRRFVSRMIRSHRGVLAVGMGCAFVSAGGLGVGLLILKPVFEVLFDPAERGSLADLAREYNAGEPFVAIPDDLIARLPVDPFAGLCLMVGVVAVLTVIGGVANFLHQFLSQTATTRAVAAIRDDAFERVLHLPLSRVVERGPSEFVARIVRDAAELQKGLIALVSRSVAHVTKGLAACVAAIIFDWRLTLFAVIVLPILAVVLRKIGKRVRRGTRGSLAAQEGLLRIATESLQGLRAVKTSNAEPEVRARFAAINEEVVRHELRVRTARALSAPLVEMLAVFAIFALALLAAKQILAGTLTREEVVLTLAALGIAGGSFRPLAGLINEVQAAAAPAERLAEIIDEPAEPDGAGLPALPAPQRRIAFEGVRVLYPGAAIPALDAIDVAIEVGTCVAIVGPNGSGKTTFASLLPRLLRPAEGRVTVDGRDLAEFELRSVRRRIGVVTQETMIFRGSVHDNIAFGTPGATREQVEAAARQAHAWEFLAALPGGFDADLAEQGASLSGGQRQRLAIARAILRNPAVLILDEATSQIDAESEGHISAALRTFMVGRTSLVIAHRLSTVQDADRILVFDGGRIVGDGTHETLRAGNDLYQRLCATQLAPDSAVEATPG